MSKLAELVEELRQHLGRIGDSEQKLVSSLRDALSRYDQKLLQDVRGIAAEHEARRGAILSELQSLAGRVGAFPSARGGSLGLEAAPTLSPEKPPALPGTPPSGPPPPQSGRLRAVEGGAWREATERLQTELDVYFKRRA